MASTGFQEWRFNQGLSSVFFYTLLKQKCTVRFMCRQLSFSSAVFISQIFYDCSMFTFFICRAAHEHTPFNYASTLTWQINLRNASFGIYETTSSAFHASSCISHCQQLKKNNSSKWNKYG